jgi:hypothetical protein
MSTLSAIEMIFILVFFVIQPFEAKLTFKNIDFKHCY